LSSGSGASVIFLLTGSPDRVGALSGRTTRVRIRPVIRDDPLEEQATLSRLPVAFRPPAFASRSSDSRRGIGPSLRSAYRRTPIGAPRTSTGLPRSARVSCDRGGCPLCPEDGGAHPGLRRVLSRRLPLHHGESLYPAPASHLARLCITRHQTRVHFIHPSGLPLACGRPDGTGRRLGFPPSFAPRRPGAGQRTSRWGQASEHGPGTTRSTSHQADPPIGSSLTACDIASQRATQV
jgi:hypothetical protein